MCNFGRGYQEEQLSEIILNLDQCFRRRCVLKIYLVWSSGGPYVQRSRTICAILVEGIMKNNSVNYFEFGPVVQEQLFKDISYLEFLQPFCSAERNHLNNFCRRYHERTWNYSVKLF